MAHRSVAGGWLLAGLAIAGLPPVHSASVQRPPAIVPAGEDVVIERLPRGYARLLPVATPTSAVARARALPSLPQVQQLLATAARTGDARLAARAEGLLARFPASTQSPQVLRARAYSHQYRHDFASAADLLDALIERDPRDADARLARMQINLVRGELARARADCAALVLGIDAGSGMLCVSMLALRSGDYATAADAADRWLRAGNISDQTQRDRQRHALLLRAEIAARARAADADAWFRRALAVAPDDVRTLAAYARYLRGMSRDRDALALLANAPDSDGLQLQRALAAKRGDPRQAVALVAAQSRRYALAHALGSEPELRDEAEFLLSLRGDPDAALALAERNFRTQRDHEDVDLLQRAAIAANRPEALAPLRAWAAAQRLALPPMAAGTR